MRTRWPVLLLDRGRPLPDGGQLLGGGRRDCGDRGPALGEGHVGQFVEQRRHLGVGVECVLDLPLHDLADLRGRRPRLEQPADELLLLGEDQLLLVDLQLPDLHLEAGLVALQVVVIAHDALRLLDELGRGLGLDAQLGQTELQQTQIKWLSVEMSPPVRKVEVHVQKHTEMLFMIRNIRSAQIKY